MSTKTTYKQTELGLIPDDWEVKKIDDVLDIFPTASYSRAEQCEDGDVQYLHYGDIHTKYNFHLKINNNNLPKISVDKLKNYKTLEIGDLIMADASEDYVGVGKCVEILELSEKKAIAGLHTFLLRDKKQNFSLGFKGYMTTSNIVKKQFYRTAVGTKVYSLSKTSLQNLKIPLPPLLEQKKIADCLSTWDCAIEKQSALINALTDRKKALMQQLLTGKKRLPGFSEEWKEVSFEKLLKQIKRKEEWDDKKLYKLLSVKRRSEGIFDREHLFGYQIAVKELMKVKKDDFLISKMQIVHGASALVNDYFENYYVSGSYIVLNIRDKRILNPEFLNYYSKQKLFYYQTYLSSYGVHIEKMTFDFKTFLKIEMTMPSLEEQTAIAEILATADRELQLQKDKLAQLQSQKKGLMQVLLTGKKRLIN